jgi:hypothetical protein
MTTGPRFASQVEILPIKHQPPVSLLIVGDFSQTSLRILTHLEDQCLRSHVNIAWFSVGRVDVAVLLILLRVDLGT